MNIAHDDEDDRHDRAEPAARADVDDSHHVDDSCKRC